MTLAGLLVLLGVVDAPARPLEAIRQRGALTLCAHPNALPFASRHGDVPGFQVEVARALAKQLGVSLEQHWVVNTFQYRRADCDIILDAIADRAMLAEVGLRMSQPYHRSGIALAVGPKSSAASLAELACTLAVVVATPEWIGVAQVGDVAVVVDRSGTLDVVRPVERGEYLNETVFITSQEWAEEARIEILDAADVTRSPVASVRIPRRIPHGLHAAWIPSNR